MSPRVQPVPITPAVLEWARSLRGYSLNEAAQRLRIDASVLSEIERGTTPLSSTTFHRMLTVYQQTESVLLLPERPNWDPLPQDFRTAGGVRATLKPDTRMAIREARRFQHSMTELKEDYPALVSVASLPPVRVDDDPEELAQRERERFGLHIDAQRSWRLTKDEPFRKWRARAQELGVFVLLKSMPWDDCRGISLNGSDLVPVIVVNSEDRVAARAFTLFHEYGHLILRESAACILQSENQTRQARIERWCNRFAAAFLMPAAAVRESSLLRFGDKPRTQWELADVSQLATEFKVSVTAMALRLKELEIANVYDTQANLLFGRDRRPRRSTKSGVSSGGPAPATVRLSEIGAPAASIVLRALSSHAIDSRQAAAILDLGAGQLGEFASRTAQQQSRDAPP